MGIQQLNLFKPFERQRQIWTPERELQEFLTKTDPGTVWDSLIREYFSRIIIKCGTITLDITNPVDESIMINFETVHDPMGKKREITISASRPQAE